MTATGTASATRDIALVIKATWGRPAVRLSPQKKALGSPPSLRRAKQLLLWPTQWLT
jgi:hypothetical protein